MGRVSAPGPLSINEKFARHFLESGSELVHTTIVHDNDWDIYVAI